MNTQATFMDGFSNAVTQSILTRTLANAFCFLMLVAALIVACIEIISNQVVNPYIASVLGTGIGYCLHVLGINQGVTLTNMKAPSTPTFTKNLTQV